MGDDKEALPLQKVFRGEGKSFSNGDAKNVCFCFFALNGSPCTET